MVPREFSDEILLIFTKSEKGGKLSIFNTELFIVCHIMWTAAQLQFLKVKCKNYF